MTGRRSGRDAGLALLAVLMIMGGAILVVTALLFLSRAEIAAESVAAERVRSRALAVSGLRAAISRLDAQRRVILEGRRPEIDEQLVIYETGSRLGVARFLPLGPGGQRLVPEAGKLDVNAAGAEALAATGLVDETLAAAIVAARSRRGGPFQSTGELLGVEGMSAATLYGPEHEALLVADERDAAGPTAGSGAARGLADAVTVFSVEPAVQRSGRLRINLNTEWSPELGRRVADRFGPEAAETLRGIFQSGTTFDTEASIIEVLRFFQVPPPQWPDIVDTFTTEAGDFHFGRLDINTAPYEALVALPGLEPEQASAIVDVRDDLTDDERATVVWPVLRDLVEPAAFERLAGRITTRCWTWRLRVAAGEADADAPDGPLAGAAVFEAVVDLSSPRPRLAYLRDVSWLEVTAALAAGGVLDDEVPWAGEGEPPPEPGLEAGLDEAGDRGDAGGAAPRQQPRRGEPVGPGGDGASAKPAAGRRRIGRWTAGG